ncbi:MAG TPA: hypothetical protein VL400_18220 [Polyangiaceae bacterium]|jgi:hypothetical protein|nr:hypothetical protein [Polyangiaceae bacterium]
MRVRRLAKSTERSKSPGRPDVDRGRAAWRTMVTISATVAFGCAAPDTARDRAAGAGEPGSSASHAMAPPEPSAPDAPSAPACPLGALRLEMDPMSIGGAPATGGPETLIALEPDGRIELALAPGKALFALDDAGCLTFEKKLIAEILPDGHIVSVRGEPIGSLSGRTLGLTHSTIEIARDGRLTQTPSPGLPEERFVGLDPSEVCAAAMLIVALGESASGASMAVVDGVAKRPPIQPSPPGSRCAAIPR